MLVVLTAGADNFTAPFAEDNEVLALGGDDIVRGGAFADLIYGDNDNDWLRGNGGDDRLLGGAGNDIVEGRGDDDDLQGDAGDDRIYGDYSDGSGDGDDTLDGGIGFDILVGGGGADTLIADGSYSHAADILQGGLGDDLYKFIYNNVNVFDALGFDRVETYTSYFTAANSGIEDLTLLGGNSSSLGGNGLANRITGNTGDNDLLGSDGGDVLIGGDGHDRLNGEAGSDIMEGGLGNDTYNIDSGFDAIVETAGQGIDTVWSTIDFTLAATPNVERLTLFGAAVTGRGNALANIIEGNSGVNFLNGGALHDILYGGLGNDTYELNDVSLRNVGGFTFEDYDAINELSPGAGGGIDTVRVGPRPSFFAASGFTTSYTLGPNLENTIVNAPGVFNAGGNALDNVITGNDQDNNIGGGVGGRDTLSGLGGKDWLDGGSDNDTLNGGLGLDLLTGGPGDDTYYLLDAALVYVNGLPIGEAYDTVSENAGNGRDRVYVRKDGVLTSYTLGATFEDGVVYDAAGFSLAGNALANLLIGNGGPDILGGGAGTAADVLQGNGSGDYMDGGQGADKMAGGLGDDAYVVDNSQDDVLEFAGQGTDTVITALNFTLAGTFENLTQTGGTNASGTGNAAANRMLGNDGNNLLQGLNGDDFMLGGGGTDTLLGGEGLDELFGGVNHDRIDGGGGGDGRLDGEDGNDNITGGLGSDRLDGGADTDVLRGEDGNDQMQGGTGTDTLYGGEGFDSVSGGDGEDFLEGGAGNDNLTGGLGLDRFNFDPGSGSDAIFGFANDQDTLVIDPGFGFASAAAVVAATIQQGTHARIILGGGNQIYLMDYLAGGSGNTIANLSNDIMVA